jgi:Derlin-2/3
MDQQNVNVAGGLLGWYREIPLISRVYLTLAFCTTLAVYADLVSPYTLYYNYESIRIRGQYWRLLSSFLFFGSFSLDFLFHMYFVIRYCRLLEEGPYRGRTGDFLFMLMFGAASMLIIVVVFQSLATIKFLGHPLAFMMVYVWARDAENLNVRMSLLGLFPFNAPYLPWVLLLFSLFLGNPIETDILGIIVGHIYYFLETVFPKVAEVRGWRLRKIIPSIGDLGLGGRGAGGVVFREHFD